MPHAIKLTADELAILVDALDSHIYWRLSDPDARSSGFVRGDGSADADIAAEIREAAALHDRLASLVS